MRWWFAVGLVACQPRFVTDTAEVDRFLARADYSSACVALAMEDDDLRAYAAEKLAEYPESVEATACVCDALYNATAGTWDAPVAGALSGSRRDDLSACLSPALRDARIGDPTPVVTALGAIRAPQGLAQLATMATGGREPGIRAAAAAALKPARDQDATLVSVLSKDSDASVRAAAAGALHGHTSSEAEAALLTALRDDVDASVRLAAITALGDRSDAVSDKARCDALMGDADAGVRLAAVGAFAGSKLGRNTQCLIRRLQTREDDGAVREATLKALARSPRSEAADALCDRIGPFLRMYVRDDFQENVPGTDIMWAQNDRDYERSYACARSALSQGSYSCYARRYLGTWIRELGGSAAVPQCPGKARL